jgi:hypothetical protein
MRCFKELSGLITCQDLQAEQLNIRVVDCIDDSSATIDVGPAHDLIPQCSARGKPATDQTP